MHPIVPLSILIWCLLVVFLNSEDSIVGIFLFIVIAAFLFILIFYYKSGREAILSGCDYSIGKVTVSSCLFSVFFVIILAGGMAAGYHLKYSFPMEWNGNW